MNDGPLCRCSLRSQKTGIRHDVYPGEKVMQQNIYKDVYLDIYCTLQIEKIKKKWNLKIKIND